MKKDVILVNQYDEEIGTMEKMEAHEKALLHRAFSIFIFDRQGRMLLQQRAEEKYHSGGLWTNACCSHPAPGETVEAAALKRLNEELGITTTLQKAFTFTYQVLFDNGLTEHEFDHVFIGIYDGEIKPDMSEVKNVSYRSLEEITRSVDLEPQIFTSWFRIALPGIREWLDTHDLKDN